MQKNQQEHNKHLFLLFLYCYGTPLNYDDWKEIDVQVKIYISTLRKEVEKKLSEKL